MIHRRSASDATTSHDRHAHDNRQDELHSDELRAGQFGCLDCCPSLPRHQLATAWHRHLILTVANHFLAPDRDRATVRPLQGTIRRAATRWLVLRIFLHEAVKDS